MDMYYYLKEKLECQDCKHPLKFSEKSGYNSYIAVCAGCEEEYEIDLEIKLHRKE